METIQELVKKANKVRYDGEYVQLVETPEGYEYLKGKSPKGVAVLVYRTGDWATEKPYLAVFEPVPAHGDKTNRMHALTGTIEDDGTAKNTAVREVMEEAGYEITADELIPLGNSIKPAKNTDWELTPFAVHITPEHKKTTAEGDGSAEEEKAYTRWVSKEKALGSQDAVLHTLIARFEELDSKTAAFDIDRALASMVNRKYPPKDRAIGRRIYLHGENLAQKKAYLHHLKKLAEKYQYDLRTGDIVGIGGIPFTFSGKGTVTTGTAGRFIREPGEKLDYRVGEESVGESPAHQPTVCVDLDGTLLSYDNWKGEEVFGDPLPGAVDAMQQFRESGWKIIIFTTRANRDLIAKALDKRGIVYDHINENPDQPGENSGKPLADVYIDDRAVRFENWDKTVKTVTDIIEKTAFVTELPKTAAYNYASIHVELASEEAENIISDARALLDPDDVVKLEDNPHITVKYGIRVPDGFGRKLPEVKARAKELLERFAPPTAVLGKIGIFERSHRGDSEVIYLRIDSPDIRRLNHEICRNLDVEHTHSDYVPHLTLAYVKPGTAKKYDGKALVTSGATMFFHTITFSGKRAGKMEIAFKGVNPEDKVKLATAIIKRANSKTISEVFRGIASPVVSAGHRFVDTLQGKNIGEAKRRLKHFNHLLGGFDGPNNMAGEVLRNANNRVTRERFRTFGTWTGVGGVGAGGGYLLSGGKDDPDKKR